MNFFIALFLHLAICLSTYAFVPRGIGSLRLQTSIDANPRKLDIGDMNTSPKELMNHELLTATSELNLAKQFKIAMHIKSQREIHKDDEAVATLLELPVNKLAALVERGDKAKRILVQANMRLVVHIAKYYRYRGVAYPDLIEEGTFGLMKAVDKFDPEKGFRFSTYASWWIKQSVSRAIAEKSRIVRLPVHIHDMMVSVSRAERQLISQLGRSPTPGELAERLALPIAKVELLLKSARNVNSMDESAFSNNGKTASDKEVQVKDRLISETKQPSTVSEKNSMRSEIRRVMGVLSEREAQIVEMRFGLSDGNQMTLEEIGKQFNVTRERIRQIEARALSKMRHPSQVEEFKEIFQFNVDSSLQNLEDTYISV
jgi:RNA polymerase sigma factor (sigma-70 family)